MIIEFESRTNLTDKQMIFEKKHTQKWSDVWPDTPGHACVHLDWECQAVCDFATRQHHSQVMTTIKTTTTKRQQLNLRVPLQCSIRAYLTLGPIERAREWERAKHTKITKNNNNNNRSDSKQHTREIITHQLNCMIFAYTYEITHRRRWSLLQCKTHIDNAFISGWFGTQSREKPTAASVERKQNDDFQCHYWKWTFFCMIEWVAME